VRRPAAQSPRCAGRAECLRYTNRWPTDRLMIQCAELVRKSEFRLRIAMHLARGLLQQEEGSGYDEEEIARIGEVWWRSGAQWWTQLRRSPDCNTCVVAWREAGRLVEEAAAASGSEPHLAV